MLDCALCIILTELHTTKCVCVLGCTKSHLKPLCLYNTKHTDRNILPQKSFYLQFKSYWLWHPNDLFLPLDKPGPYNVTVTSY